jgi:hypothetical protein
VLGKTLIDIPGFQARFANANSPAVGPMMAEDSRYRISGVGIGIVRDETFRKHRYLFGAATADRAWPAGMKVRGDELDLDWRIVLVHGLLLLRARTSGSSFARFLGGAVKQCSIGPPVVRYGVGGFRNPLRGRTPLWTAGARERRPGCSDARIDFWQVVGRSPADGVFEFGQLRQWPCGSACIRAGRRRKSGISRPSPVTMVCGLVATSVVGRRSMAGAPAKRYPPRTLTGR